jgi:predicted ATPase
MFERSEFFPELQSEMQRREPATIFGGPGAGRVSLLTFLPRGKKVSRLPGRNLATLTSILSQEKQRKPAGRVIRG